MVKTNLFGASLNVTIFFVNSAYYVDVSRGKRARRETLRKSDESNGCKRMWDLNVLGVVKTFV